MRSLVVILGLRLSAVILLMATIFLISIIINRASAAAQVISTVSVSVELSCSLSSSSRSHAATLDAGSYINVGTTSFNIACNDSLGYSLYAVGSSGAQTRNPNNTDLIATTSGQNIKTGTAISGETSSWHFKFQNPNGLQIAELYNTNHAIPATSTLVASRNFGFSAISGDTLDVTYSAFVSAKQPPSTYTGSVTYTLVSNSVASPTMQNFSCATLAENQITTLVDTRDNNTYHVAKLRDGNCWMTDNIRIGNNRKSMLLTPLNSDVTDEYTLPQGSQNGFYNDPAAQNVYIDADGGYYTWNAATANTGAELSTNGAIAPDSICPKGWKLPTAAEMNTLLNTQGDDHSTEAGSYLRSAPGNFTLSGNYYDGLLSLSGTGGYWWSSTAFDVNDAKYMAVKSDPDAFLYTHSRRYGYAVRCIARDP